MDSSRLFLIFSILLFRYLIFAGVFYLIYYVFKKNSWSYKKIQLQFPKHQDYNREIGFSLITTIIFTFYGYIILNPKMIRPYTLVYDNISDYGLGYYIISLLLILIVHDTYFYWVHRAMHSKWGMKYIHITHHKSTNPSPWAAFSFHPIEALIEASILPLIVFLFPLHPSAIMYFMFFMAFYNVYGHLGWEIYPKGFHRSIIGKWINTSINHNQHHKNFEGNYGLYFLFWDRLFGTIREDYDETFEEVTSRINHN